jgi:hypothetical protein
MKFSRCITNGEYENVRAVYAAGGQTYSGDTNSWERASLYARITPRIPIGITRYQGRDLACVFEVEGADADSGARAPSAGDAIAVIGKSKRIPIVIARFGSSKVATNTRVKDVVREEALQKWRGKKHKVLLSNANRNRTITQPVFEHFGNLIKTKRPLLTGTTASFNFIHLTVPLPCTM